MKLFACILVIISLIFIPCGCKEEKAAEGPIRETVSYCEESVEIDYPLILNVVCDTGNIEFYSWGRNEIKFEITKKIRGIQEKKVLDKRLKGFSIVLEKDRHEVSFRSAYRGYLRKDEDRSLDLRVYLPQRVEELNLKLDRGKIRMYDDIKCQLKADVNMANLSINSFKGYLDIKADVCDLRIDNGRILNGSRVLVNMGSIRIRAEFEKDGDYSFVTNTGDICLLLPADSNVGFETTGIVEANEFTNSAGLPAGIKASSGMGKIEIKKYSHMVPLSE